jgi:hypothetical protein
MLYMAHSPQRTLFQGEQVLAQWQNLTLTNLRVWNQSETEGLEAMKSILLNKVDGIHFERHSSTELVALSVLMAVLSIPCFIIGMGERGLNLILVLGMFILASSFIMMISYFLSQKTRLDIHAGSVVVGVSVTGAQKLEARAFAFQVELAAILIQSKR